MPGTGPKSLADGSARLASDPRHRLPFPTVYRIEETYAVWRNIAAPTLWVAAAESHIPAWLDDHPEGEGATDSFAGIRRRFAHIPHGTLVTIADAGHMLHHDQPEAVARRDRSLSPRRMIARRLVVRSQRGAYVALVVLTRSGAPTGS